MKRPDALVSLAPAKQTIAERVADALTCIGGVCSVTFVGSFVDRDDLSGISDIDTVVVFDRLTPPRFGAAVAAVQALTGNDVGFPERELRVNATLGPLKYDGPDQVVVHLMLYDRASHRQHVLKSPFTCLDWERSPFVWGTSLRDLYPVGRLGPGDFVSARRGLSNYISDLESGTLSFRRFEPDADRMVEVADSVVLDRRHQGEYAYHIVRNLVVNALKMRTALNRLWDEPTLRTDWTRELPDLSEWLDFYDRIRDIKLARSEDFPSDTIPLTRQFLDAFSASLDRAAGTAPTLRLVRHGRTGLNDGTFLGSGRDPSVVEPASIASDDRAWRLVYSSPLRRAQETAKALVPGATIQIDDRLAEIDYGLAEGLTAAGARERFPRLAEAWDAGDDVPFPEGEGSEDVLRRSRAFLAALASVPDDALAVTHNVVLRVMVADLLGLDLRRAYRIPIAHLEPLDVCRIGGRWLPNWGPAVKARLMDGFVGWQDRG